MIGAEIVAHHEAAHAVVAATLGAFIDRAAIDVSDDYLRSFVETTLAAGCYELQYMCCFAGVVAQRRLDGDMAGCARDFRQLEELINRIDQRDAVDLEELVRHVVAIEAITEERVEQLWPQIEEFAAQLLQSKTLAGNEIKLLGASP
jgi:hypothetical protein